MDGMNAGALTVLDTASTRIREMRPEFERLLGGVNPDRFERAVLAALAQSPELLELPAETVIEACRKAASDRLVPDGKEGAIVKRWNSRARRHEAVWQPMVKGIIKVAKLYAGVTSVAIELVYEGEPFEVLLGDDMRISHRRVLEAVQPGREVACYAIFQYGPEPHQREREVMTRAQIEAIRMRSDAGKKGVGPWASDWGEMARKTVAHRMGKRLAARDEGGELLAQVIGRVEDEYGDLGAGPDEAPAQRPAAQGEAPRSGPAAAFREAAARNASQRTRDVDPETGEMKDSATKAGGAALVYVFGDGKTESYAEVAAWRDAWLERIAAAAKKGGAAAVRAMLDRNDDALGSAARVAFASAEMIRGEAEKAIQATMGGAAPAGAAPPPAAGDDPAFGAAAPPSPWLVPLAEGPGRWGAWGPAMKAKLDVCRTPADIRAMQNANAAALEVLVREQPKSALAWTDMVAARMAALEREAAEAAPPEPLDEGDTLRGEAR